MAHYNFKLALFAFVSFAVSLSFLGCAGDFFSSGDPADSGAGGFDSMSDAGAGGSNPNTGGASGMGGIADLDAGIGGDSGSDPPDSDGSSGAGGEGGQDAGDPCLIAATPKWVATQLGVSCAPIFGVAACNADEVLTRAQLLSQLILGYLPASQLVGFEAPVTPHFGDVLQAHMAFTAIEQSYWLQLLETEGTLFFPEDPASVCWAEPLLEDLKNLPSLYSVVQHANSPDNLPPDWFWATSLTYTVYGSSPGNHFTDTVRVNNNLAGDFLVAQGEDALAQVRLLCQDPDGVGDTPYIGVPVNGSVEFSNVNCFDQSGDGFDLRVQFRVALLSQGANPGDNIRIAVDPTTLLLRGGGLQNVPTFTIE